MVTIYGLICARVGPAIGQICHRPINVRTTIGCRRIQI